MKNWMLIICPVAAIVVGAVLYASGSPSEICITVAITIWVAAWWITEPISIPATSLIPLALFPLFGILSPDDVARAYGHKLVLLMLGGFMLSAAMEKSGAHKRIALGMVNFFGSGSGRRLVFGFMAASAVLSMWISNAATTLMLLPIAMAVVSQSSNRKFQIALLLGIAYGASVGGVATPIGTPPNLVFMGVYQEATGVEIGFLDWMKLAIPVVLIMLPFVGFWLTRGIGTIDPIKLPSVGTWRKEEIRTLLVFGLTALFWVTRQQPFGGWVGFAEGQGISLPYANDASVALIGVLFLFVLPCGQGGKLLDWETAAKIPWGVLVLFAGGLCLAGAFKSSGLSEMLGNSISSLGTLPVLLSIASICLAVTFLTEVTSNTATTTILLPILVTGAIAAGVEPKLFMIPATISASFAFMLPVATPPNAIVFGSEKFSVSEMAREGLVLNLVGILIVTLVCYAMI
ncbi:SLC13 family permease [bacterium]|nr:SLC13 family permease [Mariniblastus sp.]MDB4483953.1 SLC13 family permease [bacterium]